jgi:hypothetical protein
MTKECCQQLQERLAAAEKEDDDTFCAGDWIEHCEFGRGRIRTISSSTSMARAYFPGDSPECGQLRAARLSDLRHAEPIYKRVEQNNNWSCSVAVVAMAACAGLHEVAADMRYSHYRGQPFYLVSEVIRALAEYRCALGLCVPISEHDRQDFHGPIRVHFGLYGRPALLAVKSETFRHMDHWVFWTGCEVLDPQIGKDGPRPLEDYQVVEVCPLSYLREKDDERG